MDAAYQPSAANPFITKEALPESLLSAEELLAIRHAQAPGAGNPFVTQQQLPPVLLTPEQRAALDAAQKPSGGNPFVTQSALPARELQDSERDAIRHALAPGALNPFITQSALSPDLLTPEQRAALDAAQQPSAANPFVTHSALPESQLTAEEMQAIRHAEAPSVENPFVTRRALPPDELTRAQKEALDAAHQPSAANPLATLADLAQVGVTTRTVAAGTLDLRGGIATKVLGDLRVVAAQSTTGLTTLTFAGYRADRGDNYIVTALPINQRAGQEPRSLTCVQFMEFNEEGLVLHMAQPVAGTSNLGRCMVTVNEITTAMPQLPSSEEAIKLYYALIQQERYPEAWPMLSSQFKTSIQVTTLEKYVAEWTKSGPAIIIDLSAMQTGDDKATFDLGLDYPKAIPAQRHKRIRYDFRRNEHEGHPRFGYWLFVQGKFLN